MPVWSDKLVQEAIRLILEAYYEPQFSEHSHGFRPERGCHTALREVYDNWRGTGWFIEGDISQCFDNLNHELILNTLQERIHDGRFINLIRELLDAGYMEDWTFNETLNGVPQGGIGSPILSNILLSKLDRFVETELIPKYTRGDKRKVNPEYNQLMNTSWRLRKKGETEMAERLRAQAQSLPSYAVNDPDYRRLRYIRYADDFLLGFNGPKSEAEEIKQALKTFLREELKLEMSEEKTLLPNARREAARFLGDEVTVRQRDGKRTSRNTTNHGTTTKCRSINGTIGLQVPRDVLEENCRAYMRKEKAIHRKELIERSDFHLISTYQSEYRGIVNYSRLADNMHTLSKLKWIMETSMLKTLARKFKVSVAQIAKKYKTKLTVDDKEYVVYQVTIPRQDKKPLVATWGGIPLKWNIRATLEEHPPKLHYGRTELVQRLLADFCELCGSTDDVEVHHVEKMSKLHEYPGRPKPPWVMRMIALRRKTLLLCRTCHEDVDQGRPLRRQTIELTEVQALRKRAGLQY